MNKSSKCFFCQYDTPPTKKPNDCCLNCASGSNFKEKERMSKGMKFEYEEHMALERWAEDCGDTMDKDTALAVLKDFTKFAYPSLDIFGGKTLVIRRDKFEMIRKKYLDRKVERRND